MTRCTAMEICDLSVAAKVQATEKKVLSAEAEKY